MKSKIKNANILLVNHLFDNMIYLKMQQAKREACIWNLNHFPIDKNERARGDTFAHIRIHM